MNKIYKVIWSKVKHQYVVVSELAHSNGKQSRTSRNSIRSRIAALVVCGAIAAFGVFSALQMDSAYAADVNVQQATQTQYVAFRADTTSDEWRKGEKTIEGIVFRPQTIRLSDKTLNYWVREGYTLKATEGIQYIPDNLMKTDDVNGHKSDYAISAEITDQNLIKGSVLKTTESSAVGTTAMTTRNESLQKIEVGHYTGVSNSGGVGTGTIDWNYIIDPNGQGNVNEFIDIKDAAPDQWDPSQGKYVKDVWKSGYLKEVELRGSSYYLKDTNQEVASQNVYIIGDKAGAFVTTKNGSEIYTGRVYGAHNEILMTGKDENGNYYTYWAGKVNDDDNVLLSDSNLTLGDYKENVNAFYRNDKKLAAADIKSVEVDANNNGINLITNTQFDENGKPIERTEETITGFTVTSVKNIGEDTKIQFSDGENNKFDVDAGSRVVATKDEDGKVSELSINGTKYAIGGGETYTAGDGIAIATDDNNKISVNAGDGLTFETQEGEDKGKLKVNVGDGLSITNGEVVNNFKVEADKNAADGSDDNWTITDGQQKFTNTTLVNGTVEKRAIQDNAYGSDYLVKDTDGNTATLKDVASATKLQSIDTTKIGNLKYSAVDIEDNTIKDTDTVTTAIGKLDSAVDKAATEAGKHTSVSVGDNLGINETPNGNGGTNYKVTLDDTLYLGGNHTEGDSKITLDGATGTAIIGNSTSGKATIGGVNITTTAEEGTGKPVSTINGLSNTTWTGTTETPNRAATEGQLEDLSDTVNTGWYVADKDTAEDSTTGNFAVKPGETLTFNGDDNIDVEAKDHKVNVSLKDNITLGEGNSQININGNPENGEAALSIGDKFVVEQNGTTTIVADDGINNRPSQAQLTPDTTVTIAPSGVTFAGDDKGTTIIEGQKITSGGIVINGEDIYDKTTGIVTKGTITGLSNTTWDGKTDNASRVATEGQLKAVSDDVNAGWIATDSQNHEVNITPDNNKLNFAGDENVTVTAANNEIKVALNDDIVLGDYLNGDDGVLIGGSSGTISATNSITVGEDQGLIIDGQKKEIQGLSNTTWNEDVANAVERDSVAASTAATQGQLQEVSKVANAGWNASDGTNSISVKPNETLNFVGDENLTVSADGTDKKLKVSLNDNITLGDGQSAITLNGSPQNSDDPALSVGTDKFVVAQDGSLSVSDKFNVDAETGNIYAANNSGSAIMMNDDSVALNAGGNGIAISDEGILLNTNGINEDIKLVTKGTSVSVDSNGTTFTNTNTNETTNINGGTINVGDKLMVEEDGSIYATNNNGSTVMINDNGVALNSEGNGVVVSGEGITLNTNGSAVTVDRFNGTTFTNTNTGETTSINGGTITTDTVKGLSNTTWNDELATQVAKSEELQGTAATQGQLQQAVSAVATEAAKQHTTVSGDDNLTVKSSVNENGGTNYQVTLDDDITLGNPKAGNTEGERSFTINTTDPEGYVPESYKTGSGANFIEENGGFMLFATDTQGFGVFGVTAKGSAWAKDFETYTTDIYGNNTKYSLNEIGDAVAQMSSYYNEENGKSYTVFSRYLNEAEKDNPFVTVDDNATRDIPLALRDDGAVLIGATIKGEDFTDNGIRINAETETTYDEDGNEVTNNIATITGLENTEWKPPTPVATFAANDINTTSRAATEAQLNDLYNTVAAYDVNADGTVNYNHITLAGTPYNYGLSRSTDGTPTGGTSITNVAYASGNDGSEAVNVDYLKDAIKDAVKDGPVASNEKHLDTSKTYTPDKTTGKITIAEVDGTGQTTGNQLVINDVASKAELDSLKTNVGDLSYSKVQGDDVKDGDSVTTAIGKLDNKIENISGTATDADNNTVTGGKINSDGTISLTQKDKDSIKLEGQLTDSGVVQEGTSFDKETGTITITSQDKYSGETSSVKVEGIASTEVVGATNKEDLATAYKDADKDGNATTEYITDSESMVEADVALDHAIQDVAGTSYANDMVLSNRIDSVEKRLGNVEERIDKVGAMAAAIANLRTMGFDPEAPTEIAIGVGQYKSETGIAIGVFHYPNQDFMLSASLSSSGDELMGGIGATWKLGRKSAAERAKDEEARHLEQAEEMKKLAQQEKVKAQAQRHAKLLAERQQASQKNA